MSEEAKKVVVIWHPDGEETTLSHVVRHTEDTLENAVMSHLGQLLSMDAEITRRDVYIDHVISLPEGEGITFAGMLDESFFPKENPDE